MEIPLKSLNHTFSLDTLDIYIYICSLAFPKWYKPSILGSADAKVLQDLKDDPKTSTSRFPANSAAGWTISPWSR